YLKPYIGYNSLLENEQQGNPEDINKLRELIKKLNDCKTELGQLEQQDDQLKEQYTSLEQKNSILTDQINSLQQYYDYLQGTTDDNNDNPPPPFVDFDQLML